MPADISKMTRLLLSSSARFIPFGPPTGNAGFNDENWAALVRPSIHQAINCMVRDAIFSAIPGVHDSASAVNPGAASDLFLVESESSSTTIQHQNLLQTKVTINSHLIIVLFEAQPARQLGGMSDRRHLLFLSQVKQTSCCGDRHPARSLGKRKEVGCLKQAPHRGKTFLYCGYLRSRVRMSTHEGVDFSIPFAAAP